MTLLIDVVAESVMFIQFVRKYRYVGGTKADLYKLFVKVPLIANN